MDTFPLKQCLQSKNMTYLDRKLFLWHFISQKQMFLTETGIKENCLPGADSIFKKFVRCKLSKSELTVSLPKIKVSF